MSRSDIVPDEGKNLMAAEVRWLSEEEQFAWRAYLRATAMTAEALNHALMVNYNLSLNEYDVLARLSEAENRCMRMSTLADVMVHSRSRLTHTVRRLEARGLVARSANAHDRRGVDCTLTDAGFALLEKAAVTHVISVRAHLVDKLGHDDFLKMGELCARLEGNPADIWYTLGHAGRSELPKEPSFVRPAAPGAVDWHHD